MMVRCTTFITALALAACGGKDKPKPDTHAPPTSATDTAVAATPDTAAVTSAAPDTAAPTPPGPSALRSKLPAPGPPPKWAPPTVDSWTLDNGIEVWHLQQTQAPLISLQLVLPGGSATDPKGKAGLTALMVDLLDEGAGKLDALALADAFQRLATDFGASPTTDGILVGMDMLADKLEPSLALMADVLLRPSLPKEEFDRRKAQRIANALANEADPGTTAALVMRREIFGELYGGYPPDGVRGTIEAITYEDVKRQFNALMKPKGATLIVVGNVDKATLSKAVTDALGAWSGEPVIPARPRRKGRDLRIAVVDFPDAPQTALYMARRADGVGAEALFPETIFNRAFGGAFTSRLNLNLREDKGYTYGARSSFNRFLFDGSFSLGAKVKADTTRASLDEMRKELSEMGTTRPISDAERDEAVDGLLLGFPGRFQSMSSIASELSDLALEGRPLDWFVQWPTKIEAVTTEAANAAAKAYGDVGDYVIVAAGDAKLIREALGVLKLPFQRYDTQGNPKK